MIMIRKTFPVPAPAPYAAPLCQYRPAMPVKVLEGSVTGGNPETWDEEEDDSGNW